MEIFADFSSLECYEILNEMEKNKTESDKVKWRAYLQDPEASAVPTQYAHILGKWAGENKIGNDYRRIVYYYFFVLKKDISKTEVLEEIIGKLGFDEVKIEEVIKDEKYLKLFDDDLNKAKELGIESVPAILADGKIVSKVF